jgi:16S rRNA (cytidine1402-2'-O)-methyltransferase
VSGTLVLAATPIGQVADASGRLPLVLAGAAVVAAEDTRRLRRLLDALDVTPTGRVVSYFEGNEERRTPELLDVLLGGGDVVVVTDAGMPSVSDPGYRLVAAAVTAGVPVTVVPGPSAVTAALAVSGLPVDRFCFEGFLPRKPGERARRLAELATEPRTMVFFEAPHRTAAALSALAEAFGADRPAVACRELTKTYEEVRRGGLGELATWAGDGVRGEVTLVVHGAASRGAPDRADVVARVAAWEQQGLSRRDAVAAVAAETGVRRRSVYDLVHRG